MSGNDRGRDEPEELVDADDAVIGRALRLSLVLGLVGALLIVAALVLARRRHAPPRVDEAAVSAPKSRASGDTEPPPDVRFTDVTRASGIGFVQVNGAYGETLLPETMGGGVAFLDYD